MKAVQLLLQAASMYHEQKEILSKTEILKRINQIKYLSKKKGSSKFEIRKEIVKLENQMQQIFELEKRLLSRERKESSKVASLKRQLTVAKKKLVASEDHDLAKKVDRLSHLIGDFLAKNGTFQDVGLTEKLIKELNIKLPHRKTSIMSPSPVISSSSQQNNKLEHIQSRLQLLKKELETKKSQEKNPQVIAVIQKQIEMLDKKVQAYASQPHIATEFILNVKSASERHIIKFAKEPIGDLPPPPQPKYS